MHHESYHEDTQLFQLYNGMYNLCLYGIPKYFKFRPLSPKVFLNVQYTMYNSGLSVSLSGKFIKMAINDLGPSVD